MTLTPQITKVYDWNDIEKELCRIMEIPEDTFRDYHKVVGGAYKDFWHVSLSYVIPEGMTNGSTMTLWSVDEEWLDFDENDKWKLEVIRAWNKLYETIDETGTDSGVQVRFWW